MSVLRDGQELKKYSIYQSVSKDELILLLLYLMNFDDLVIKIKNNNCNYFKVYGYQSRLEIRGFN